MKVSIIIPCLNEEETVGKLLRQLRSQTNRDFEVIVVDSGSVDRTVEVARSFAGLMPLRVIKGSDGVAAARNAGASAGQGEWLLFLDADVSVSRDLIRRFLEDTTGLELASLRFRAASRNWFGIVGTKLYYFYYRVMARTPSPLAGGWCLWVQRSLHDALGGFDTALFIMEDYDYVDRAVQAGARFGFIASAEVGVSMRRFEREGWIKTSLKILYAEVYRYTRERRIKRRLFSYEMGGRQRGLS